MQLVLGSHRQRTYLEHSARPQADTRVLAFLRLGGLRTTGKTGILTRPVVEESSRAEVAEGGVTGTCSSEESSGGQGAGGEPGQSLPVE